MATYLLITSDRRGIAIHATSDREARTIARHATRATGTTVATITRSPDFYGFRFPF